jgi:hypothetical protein
MDLKWNRTYIYLYDDRITFDDIQFIPLERVKLAEISTREVVKSMYRGIGGGQRVRSTYYKELIISFVNKDGKEASINLISKTIIPDLSKLARAINNKIGVKSEKKTKQKNNKPNVPYEL